MCEASGRIFLKNLDVGISNVRSPRHGSASSRIIMKPTPPVNTNFPPASISSTVRSTELAQLRLKTLAWGGNALALPYTLKTFFMHKFLQGVGKVIGIVATTDRLQQNSRACRQKRVAVIISLQQNEYKQGGTLKKYVARTINTSTVSCTSVAYLFQLAALYVPNIAVDMMT